VRRELVEPEQYIAKERAAHLALFWVGAAQVDLGDCVAGRNSMRQFLKASLNPLPSVDSWNAAARLQSLRCVLESGDTAAAQQILDEMEPGLPQWRTAHILLDRAAPEPEPAEVP
jgi:hypothetical protein